MACSLAATHSRRTSGTDLEEMQGSRRREDNDINTGREFGDLTPAERDAFLSGIEMDFRRHIAETRPSTGFAFYPSTRQIMKAISALYETLANIDFSDVFE